MLKKFAGGRVVLIVGSLALGACVADNPGLPDPHWASGSSPIIGGTTDHADDAVALLVFTDPSNASNEYVCTGTLIASNVILTAGHCSVQDDTCNGGGGSSTCHANNPAGYQVLGGSSPINSSTWAVTNPTWTASVTAVHPNPGYGSSSNGAPKNDTAILVIGNIHVINGTMPQPMPWLSSSNASAYATGNTIRAVGYGVTNASSGAGVGTKRQVTLTITGHDSTGFSFGSSAKNTCSGDSGGPAIESLNGVDTLIGTTSYGDQNCTQVGVDMRSDAASSFISQYTGSPSPTPTPNPTSTPNPTPTPQPGCMNTTFSAPGLPLAIPDNDASGVTSTLNVSGSGTIASLVFSAHVTHTYQGDLTVTLISPSGTPYVAFDQTGGATNNVSISSRSVTTFDGEPAAGNWKVKVVDHAAQDVGTLDSWSLTIVGDCTGGGASSWSMSATPALATVDNGSACTSITVSGSGNAADAKLDVSGTHDYRSILRGTLTHGGVTRDAFPVGTFATGPGAFSFNSRAVSGFSGAASGTWKLCIIDTDAYGDTGSLASWRIHN